MKLNSARCNQGNTLITVIIFTGVLSILMVSYLTMAKNSITLTARSMVWNDALPVAEAGIEEAAAAIQAVPSSQSLSATLQTNGWTASGNVLTKTRNLTNAYFTVLITSTNTGAAIGPYNCPIIYSTGYVQVPISTAYIRRIVQVTTLSKSQFRYALAVRNSLTTHGNGVFTDSFDSSDPNLSTGGLYDSSKTSTNGDVASLFGPVDLGNHSISGGLTLGPTAQSSALTSAVSGGIKTNSSMTIPDVVLPAAAWLTPAAGNLNQTISGTTYGYAFTLSGDYQISSSGTVYVAPFTNVRLYVTASSFSPGGTRIAGTGASAGQLTIYMSGASCTMGGGATVDSGNATNFIYYGLPSNTSITFSGNSSFLGIVYAPEADMTLNGGGNGSGFMGSCTVNSLTMNGHYNFHYDQNLGTVGPSSSAFKITSWSEL